MDLASRIQKQENIKKNKPFGFVECYSMFKLRILKYDANVNSSLINLSLMAEEIFMDKRFIWLQFQPHKCVEFSNEQQFDGSQ